MQELELPLQHHRSLATAALTTILPLPPPLLLGMIVAMLHLVPLLEVVAVPLLLELVELELVILAMMHATCLIRGTIREIGTRVPLP